jgi:hypothetical protein
MGYVAGESLHSPNIFNIGRSLENFGATSAEAGALTEPFFPSLPHMKVTVRAR